ncbi:hypothetical protein K1X76_07390 [bacterium]|nr:hypothetical protein [bacterium]
MKFKIFTALSLMTTFIACGGGGGGSVDTIDFDTLTTTQSFDVIDKTGGPASAIYYYYTKAVIDAEDGGSSAGADTGVSMVISRSVQTSIKKSFTKSESLTVPINESYTCDNGGTVKVTGTLRGVGGSSGVKVTGNLSMMMSGCDVDFEYDNCTDHARISGSSSLAVSENYDAYGYFTSGISKLSASNLTVTKSGTTYSLGMNLTLDEDEGSVDGFYTYDGDNYDANELDMASSSYSDEEVCDTLGLSAPEGDVNVDF